jgi:hypothetical protein
MTNTMSHATRAPYVAALAQAQDEFMAGTRSLEYRDGRFGQVLADADTLGGRDRRTLRRIAWLKASERCAHCRQATRLDVAADAADAATLALLIPASVIGASNERLGYVPSNVCSMCRTCVNLSNDVNRHSDAWVWSAGTFDAESVLTEWPSLPKSKPVLKVESTVDPAKHLAECLRVAAARGINL